MKNLSFLSFLLVAVLVLSACNKDNEDEIIQTAGKGGNATLRVYPAHHNAPIDSCTVYLKYNADEKPSSYDETQVCAMINSRGVATFTNLKGGTYYLYAEGYDPAVAQNVRGGQSFNFSEEKAYDIDLAVSEE